MKSTLSIPRTLIIGAINFFILSGIFILSLMARERQLKEKKPYVIRGILLALLSSVIFILTDIITGGIASLMLLTVYPLASLTMLTISVIQPSFLSDIPEQKISVYRLWSVSFWSWFIISMIYAIICSIMISYLSAKISRVALEMISNIANNISDTGSIQLSTILSSL